MAKLDINSSDGYLEFLLIQAPKKTQKDIQELIKECKDDYFKFKTDDEWGFAEYFLAKNCPVEAHVCGWISEEGHSVKCAHYNAFKKNCIYPRTCIHNHFSENNIGMDDNFSGNIQRYYDPKEGKSDEEQILEKGRELGVFDKDAKEATYGWEYAEFEDDGEKITLVELVSEGEVKEALKKQKEEKQDKLKMGREEMKSELKSLIDKYSGGTKKDLEKAVELTKKLIPPNPFFNIDF